MTQKSPNNQDESVQYIVRLGQHQLINQQHSLKICPVYSLTLNLNVHKNTLRNNQKTIVNNKKTIVNKKQSIVKFMAEIMPGQDTKFEHSSLQKL